MNSPYTLFKTFFTIGIATIGGGYAMIPMMEREIVHKKQLLNKEEFLDILAIAQASPGVFAVNMTSNIGYHIGGVRMALLLSIANILPSILIILFLALTFYSFRSNIYIEYCFKAIRPVVVGLVLAPVLTLAQNANLNKRTIWLPIATTLAICCLGISPIYVVLLGVVLGLCYGIYLDWKLKRKE